MGLFDDLDNAFDQLLSPSPKEETETQEETDVGDPVESAAADLKAALAEAQKVCVNALVLLLDQFPRAPILAAIHGSLQHLAMIEVDLTPNSQLQTMTEIMTTKKGHTRKRLSQSQLAKLRAFGHTLPQPKGHEIEQAKSFLTALTHQRAVSPREYMELYKAGIWQSDQFCNGSPDQLAALSGLPISTIHKLKDAVNLG